MEKTCKSVETKRGVGVGRAEKRKRPKMMYKEPVTAGERKNAAKERL